MESDLLTAAGFLRLTQIALWWLYLPVCTGAASALPSPKEETKERWEVEAASGLPRENTGHHTWIASGEGRTWIQEKEEKVPPLFQGGLKLFQDGLKLSRGFRVQLLFQHLGTGEN